MFDLSQCERDENGHWKAQTRDGNVAIIVGNNAPGRYPLMGVIAGSELARNWQSNGRYVSDEKDSPCDLIVPPRKRTVTVEIWRYPHGSLVSAVADPLSSLQRPANAVVVKTLTAEIEV